MAIPTLRDVDIKFLHVELSIKRENHKAFADLMEQIVPIMFNTYGWELVYGAYPIIGKTNLFVHIWKIPNEQSVLEVMRDGAAYALGRPRATVKDDASGTFVELYTKLQGIIDETKHTLMTSLGHDPTQIGNQTQTIVIDDEGEPFIIEHEELIKRADKDISRDLAASRSRRRTERGARGARNIENQLARRRAEKEQGKEKFAWLDWQLNNGAITAERQDGDNRTLLFNLAGLKPRSVFQRLEPAAADAGDNTQVGDGKLQAAATVIIAAPWGAIYELTQAELRTLAKPIPQVQLAETATRLAPIVQSHTPIASVPEDREVLIGDGCMCFVINLNSYVATEKRGQLCKRLANA